MSAADAQGLFAAKLAGLVDGGIDLDLIGGCCGSTEAHIAAMRDAPAAGI